MAEIQDQIPVTLASVEVSDDYRIEVTVTDPRTLESASTLLTWSQAEVFFGAALAKLTEAQVMAARDFPLVGRSHGFDVDEVSS